jgi:predicted DNA-binding protein
MQTKVDNQGSLLSTEMTAKKQDTVSLKVTMPKKIHEKLKELSENRGIPMATLLLIAAIEKYNLNGERQDP